MDMGLFFLNGSNLSSGNSDNKCLKLPSFKFPAKESNEPFKNCSESKNTMLFLTIMLIYLSSDLGINWISISLKLFSSLKIKCPSYPSKLWKIMGIFQVFLILNYNSLCAAPLNLPVIWQWSLTLSLIIFSLHIQQYSEFW